MASQTLAPMLLLLAVLSAACVDAPAVAPEWVAATTSDPIVPAAAQPPTAPAPKPEPAPSPPARNHTCILHSDGFGAAGFAFTSFGMMGQAIPWFVFPQMTPEDWRRQQFDAYSEWTMLFDIVGCFSTLILHLVFLPKKNVDTFLVEFAGVAFAMQQVHHVHEKRLQANTEYAKESATGRKALFCWFWIFLVLQVVIFYFLQHPPKLKDNTVSDVFAIVFGGCAIAMQVLAVLYPFYHRWRKNNWQDDAKASRKGKFLGAAIQVISSGFDVWNYHCNELYWFNETGRMGSRLAMVLAYTCTGCGVLLLFARVTGPVRFRRFWHFIRGTEEPLADEEAPPYDAATAQPLSPEVVIRQLEARLKEEQMEVMRQKKFVVHLQVEAMIWRKCFQDGQNLLKDKVAEQEELKEVLASEANRQTQLKLSIANVNQQQKQLLEKVKVIDGLVEHGHQMEKSVDSFTEKMAAAVNEKIQGVQALVEQEKRTAEAWAVLSTKMAEAELTAEELDQRARA